MVIFVWSCSSWTNRCGEGLPALLGSAEEGRDEAMLGGLQDGIPVCLRHNMQHTIYGRLRDRPCLMFVVEDQVHAGGCE